MSQTSERPSTGRPRILLAWEHGRNLGHISRLLAMAQLVEEQGGEPVWAVPPGPVRISVCEAH